eukprot:scaffold164829_cov43-Tisochrysis_lutea.AAC.1
MDKTPGTPSAERAQQRASSRAGTPRLGQSRQGTASQVDIELFGCTASAMEAGAGRMVLPHEHG